MVSSHYLVGERLDQLGICVIIHKDTQHTQHTHTHSIIHIHMEVLHTDTDHTVKHLAAKFGSAAKFLCFSRKSARLKFG